MAKNILVTGWFGHGNCGDESYKLAFPAVFPGYNFQFVERIPKQHQADAYILGGGNVLSPAFLDQYQLIKDKPKHLVSVSAFGEVDAKLLQGFDQVLVRDVRSKKILEGKGIKCTLMPDIAFSFQSEPEEGYMKLRSMFQTENLKLYNKIVTIIVNAYVAASNPDVRKSKDEFAFLSFCYDLAEIMDNTAASFVFIPFCTRGPADDRIANSWVASKCKYWDKNMVVYDKLSVQDTLNIIGASDAVVSMRLHSSIFSCVANTPFVDITHHDKNLGFLETIGKTDRSISYWNFDKEKCYLLLNETLKNPEPHKSDLQGITKEQKRQLAEVSRNVCLCKP